MTPNYRSPSSRRPSRRFRGLPYRACAFLALSSVAAFAQNQPSGNFPNAPYYPDPVQAQTVSSLSYDAIQARLTLLDPTASLSLKPLAGFHTVTDSELGAAVAQTIADQLTSPGSFDPSVTTSSLVRAALQYRPAQAAALMAPIANAIIANAPSLVRAALLADATTQAIQGHVDNNAAPVTTAVISAIAKSAPAASNSVDVAVAAIAASTDLADKITAAAINSAKSAGTSQTTAIAAAAAQAVVQNNASYLIGQVTASAIQNGTVTVASPANGSVVTSTSIFDNVLSGLVAAGVGGGPTDRPTVLMATIYAAGAAGANANTAALQATVAARFSSYSGSSYASATYAALDTFNQIEATLTARATALHRTLTPAEAGAIAETKLTAILGANSQNGDAATAAALIARPVNAIDLVRVAVLAQPASAGNIVELGVRTLQNSAALIVASAVKEVVRQGGAGVATGAAQAALVKRGIDGARPALDGAIAVAGLQQSSASGALTDDKFSAVITAAEQEAELLGNTQSLGDIAIQVAKTYPTIGHKATPTSKIIGQVDASTYIVKAAVAGVGSGDLLGLAEALAGTISVTAAPGRTLTVGAAATKANGLLTAALSVISDPTAQSVLTLAEHTVRDVLANKLTFYTTTNTALAGATTTAQVQAIVYAAGIANPAGISAIASAAFALPSSSRSAIQTAALGANPGAVKNVQVALDTVAHINAAASPGADLFDYIGQGIAANSGYTTDLVTGAVIAAPQFANVIASAAAFRAPQLSAGKVVPAIFAFGNLTQTKSGSPNDGSARIAAIMAGITTGIIRSQQDVAVPEILPSGVYNPRYQATQTVLLKENVVAVVKAALTFPGSFYPVAYPVSSTVTLSNGHLVSSNSAPGQTSTDVGPAGAITGLVSQTTKSGDSDINLLTVGSIVKAAAATAGEKYWITIAQAAAQAFVAVSGTAATFDGSGIAGVGSTTGANIVSSILNSLPLGATERGNWLTLLQNAVAFGAQEVQSHTTGIGAKGVVDYAHHSATGQYVTNIFDL